jgi:RNA polymerase sigma factor (sigma-70 family)
VWRLPKRQRTLVALRFGAGLSYREIGHQLGLSEAAALMAVRRALTRLRHELQHREAHS